MEGEENRVKVYGRWIPLTDVRKKFLEAQEEFMHLDTREKSTGRVGPHAGESK